MVAGAAARELALIAVAAVVYGGVRALTEGDATEAGENALQILRLERALHLDWERALQAQVLGHPALVTLANWIYIFGHWPVIVAAGVFLYVRHRDGYTLLRNAMFISGAAGFLFFALFPVAPPRLLHDGLVDTILERSHSYRALQPPALTNEYASMPSLHFGWNLLVGLVLALTLRRPAAYAFAVLMPLAMGLTVVVTANHYVVDVLVGGTIVLISLAFAALLAAEPLPIRSSPPDGLRDGPDAPKGAHGDARSTPMSGSKRTREPLRVVVAGGGVAGLEAVLALRALAGELVELELLAPEDSFSYRPLSVAEPFGQAAAPRFDLAEIAGHAGARHVRDALASVDAERHRIRTGSGDELEYDALVVAAGAVPVEALPGAVTFGLAPDFTALRKVLDEAASGALRRLAFAVAGGITWPLPLYELALLASAELSASESSTELILVTPEDQPLGLFGSAASTATASLLAVRGIAVLTARHASTFANGRLELIPDGGLVVDRVISLPRLQGPAIPGLPQVAEGFTPTDRHSRVPGLVDVYAAGDMTAFPLKQGGIAAQQADAAAEMIAARAGADLTPAPFAPVLRGLLLTGAAPRYMTAHVEGGRGETSLVEIEPLWWPPGKIVGRYLAPFLAEHVGEALPEPEPGPEVIPVDVDLD